MKDKFELLNVGMSDSVDILSVDDMSLVVGGDVECKKKYKKGGSKCKKRYLQTSTVVCCGKGYSDKRNVETASDSTFVGK